MNVEKIESGAKLKIPFPKLMESIEHGYVALFSSEGTGTVVFIEEDCGRSMALGEHSTSLPMEWFKDFTGKLISSN